MKPLWKTAIILTAIAGAIITAILIFQKTNQPSIALTEEWTATQVIDGDSITVRQTDGSQIEVELCGIDAPKGIGYLGTLHYGLHNIFDYSTSRYFTTRLLHCLLLLLTLYSSEGSYLLVFGNTELV
ncbi:MULTISPECIES: hypothetical protein [unclassified Nostoc]|uniref:hypothetical protein n=1 Tax=unclassified Nostoc TaxID=2593658 RepID=UPI00167B4BCF|nr:hypothetical protein [Nostoc sp. 'Peltigera membranacea cyanobiont' 232]